MHTTSFLAAVMGLFLTTAPAPVIDLNRLERTIAKEPLYQTHLPKYCLLVFGPAASARVWCVIDGETLYIDRNRNGDLTEPADRVPGKRSGRWLAFEAGPVTTDGGKAMVLRLHIREFQIADGRCTGMELTLDGQRKQYVGFDESNPFRFGQRAGQAPIIRVDGPLEMRLYREPPTLIAGAETEINICVGTPGLDAGSFCAIQCCTILSCKVSPVAYVEFPAREAGRPPQTLRVAINDD
jgi:hypothetical protein